MSHDASTQKPQNPHRSQSVLGSLRVLRFVVVFAIATVSGHAVPHAQTPSQPRQVFRSGTELVLVNVVVRDKSGAVVRNLSRDDFTVTEDDKPQTITSFDFEELSPSPVATDRAASATPAQSILSSPGRADADDPSAKASAERPPA